MTQSGQSWGSAPGLLTPLLQHPPLLPQTPPPMETPAPAVDPPELWFGEQCSGKGRQEPRGHWAWGPRSHVGVASLPFRLTMLLSLQVGARRVDTMGFLEPLFQLLWAGAFRTQPALHPVSSEQDTASECVRRGSCPSSPASQA